MGIYAHGKIAQDRPFVFGIKGREITTRYMYGVVEADWLDELGEEDIISTDRTSINWDNDDASEMYEWGAKLVAKWVNDYRKHQKEKNKDKIIDKIKSLPKELRVTDTERDAITNMVCNMSPKIYKDDQLQNEVIHNLTSAWLHEPARQVIKALWDTLKNTDIESNDFLVLIKKINNHLVPESLSLSVTVAQKIYALTKLYELSNIGTEDQLQPLLEEFPWILGTDKDIVTANKNLKNMAHQAAKAGIIPSHGKIKKDIKNHPDESLRPDFCFFSDAQEHTIYIVELKSPTIDLDYDHLSQLQSYMNWMRRSYSDARVEGILIGRNPTAITHSDNNIKITSWLDLCAQSRKDYIDLLMSMLYGIPEHLDDSRITKVLEFSGDAAQSLMLKFKDSNPRLQERFSDIDKSIGV
ncbi:type I restriction enzyme HsdR N-terminal domain-containing protein [Oligella ureolytica]|uniref:type I restriction enzyme HsdR N-terminal domain-containing protein n=1 Tax=Oligella ureolytica TaxID=90244 RepID=UPI0011C0350A|nr:type I restriction enzyme HsdR N-terminal domain-containing protein [Oligella ureolytica]